MMVSDIVDGVLDYFSDGDDGSHWLTLSVSASVLCGRYSQESSAWLKMLILVKNLATLNCESGALNVS